MSTNWAVVAVFFAPSLSRLEGLPWYSALPRLRGVDAPIFFSCAGCRLVLCPSCAARPPPVHPELFVCVGCSLRGVGLPAAGAGSASRQAEWVRLVHGADSLASARHRASTRGAYNRAVADFVDFCRARGVEPLPAQPEAVRAYVFHCTADRGLDAQTVMGSRVTVARGACVR